MKFDWYKFIDHMKDGSLMALGMSCASVLSRTVAVYIGTAKPFTITIPEAVGHAALFVLASSLMKYYFPPKEDEGWNP